LGDFSALLDLYPTSFSALLDLKLSFCFLVDESVADDICLKAGDFMEFTLRSCMLRELSMF